ncbi:CARDB domain-containing protein, partial [Roseovarius sp. D22-M7]|uniref:CARDB domain-containing protein n=1 Tax=Roseovarius sp. D22-M7 TaxID=3127116 RepID=UPI00300F893A
MSVDLRITNVETDKNQYASGEDITVDWQVRNSGTADAATTASGVFLFTADFSDSWFLGSQSAGTSGANTFDNETDTFQLPSSLPAGNYILSVQADYDLRVSESNEFNNATNVGISIFAAEPDLVPQQVRIDGSTVLPGDVVSQEYAPGDDITVSWEVWNIGDGFAGSSDAGLYLVGGGAPIVSVFNSTRDLDGGEEDTSESSTLSLPDGLAPGRYTIRLAADARGEVDESTEANNFYAFEIDVVEAGEPDLVPQQVRIDGTTVLPGDVVSQEYAPGDDITVSWEVWNIGDGVAGSSDAGLYLVGGGAPLVSVFNSTRDLDGGEEDTGESSTLSLPDDLAPGRYTIRLAADARGEVDESTEANNFYAFEIDVAEDASSDSVNEGTDTSAGLTEGTWEQGTIDAEPISGDGVASDGQGGFIDKDWYRVTLDPDLTYSFDAQSLSLTTGIVFVRLYDSVGNEVGGSFEAEGAAPSFTFNTAGQSGSETYYLAVSAGDSGEASQPFRSATGDFRVRFTDEGPFTTTEDDFADEPSETGTTQGVGQLLVGDQLSGVIGAADANDGTFGDKDAFAVSLQAGNVYSFTVDGSNGLSDAIFTVRDAGFSNVLATSSEGDPANLTFTATTSGTHYIRVGTGVQGQQGNYVLSATNEGAAPTEDDFADEPSETGTTQGVGQLLVGDQLSGVIGAADANDGTFGDKDAFAVSLQAGNVYRFNVDGSNGLSDAIFTVRDAGFSNVLATSSEGDPANLTFTATTSGTHYIRVGTGAQGQQGNYVLSATSEGAAPTTPVPNSVEEAVIVELVHLADWAYRPPHDPADPANSGPINRTGWAEVTGAPFATITPNTAADGFGKPDVNLHVYEGNIEGARVLALAFSGTADPLDLVSQIGSWETIYDEFSPTIASILSWSENDAQNADRPFEKLFVTGHSLGGVMVEELMADSSLSAYSLARDASGVTFGSPGSPNRDNPNFDDSKLTNFVTLGDVVPMLSSESFFDTLAAPGEEKNLYEKSLAVALTVKGAVGNKAEALTTATEIVGGEAGVLVSRDGTTVTMVNTDSYTINVARALASHPRDGELGYIRTVEKLSNVFDGSRSNKLDDFFAWENSSGGWRFTESYDDLGISDYAIAFDQGLNFGIVDILGSLPRLLINGASGYVYSIPKIIELVEDGFSKGVSSIGQKIEGTRDKFNTTIENTRDYIEVRFLGEDFNEDSAGYEGGSAIISIDYDLDGITDTTTTLLGDFDLSRFFVVPDETGTRVIYSERAQYQSSEGKDVLIGDASSESFSGFGGNDYILALSGDDVIFGGGGNDVVDGGPGNDTMTGGPGDDVFVKRPGESDDTITD